MSHFVGVAFIPRDDDYEVNEDYSKAEQNLDNMFSMGEALQSEYLTELLAPYNEQDDRYCEVSPDLNDRATTLLQAYYSRVILKKSMRCVKCLLSVSVVGQREQLSGVQKQKKVAVYLLPR